MLSRDAGWAALAALLYGWCCWHLAWGVWPEAPGIADSTAAGAGPVGTGHFGWPG